MEPLSPAAPAPERTAGLPAASGHHLRAVVALLAAATVWGATFVLVQDTLRFITPEFLVAARFLLGGIVLLAIELPLRKVDWRALRPASVLAILLLGGYWLQTRGLLEISPSRSAFLTGVGVAFVPFIDRILFGAPLRKLMIAGAIAASGGLYFLVGGIEGRVFFGDVLTLAGAVLFATHLAVTARVTRRYSELSVASLQVLFVGLFSSPALALSRPVTINRFVVFSLLFLAIVTTSFAVFAMTWGAARVTASEGAIILAWEPVAAAITSIGFYGERATFQQHVVGGGLIVVAMILSQWKRS